MKALHVTSGNLYGGVESMLVTLARFRDSCPDLEQHFALSFEGRLLTELTAVGASVNVLGAARLSRPFSVRRARQSLRALIEARGFDVMICHAPWSLVAFGPVAREFDLPLVMFVHGAHAGQHWLERLARRVKPDLAICNSRYTEQSFRRLFPQVKSFVLYPPVSPEQRHGNANMRQDVRQELAASADAVIVVQASRMEAWKGHRALLEGLRGVATDTDWCCWIAGGPQTAKEEAYFRGLCDYVRDTGLSGRVRFLGMRGDVRRLLAAADIYCQPNDGPEPFGISFVEAMSERLPVVTTQLGGAAEIVNERTGFLIQPGDLGALSRALERLIEDADLRRRLGNEGRRVADELCNPGRVATSLASYLRPFRPTDVSRSGGTGNAPTPVT